MASGVDSKIMAALFGRLATLALSPALPIAWPNLSFTAPASKKFLRVQYVPNVTNRRFVNSDGRHEYLGLLQVSVQWPIGTGEAQPREVAGKVADQFPADLRLLIADGYVRIAQDATVSDLIVEDAQVQIPVIIQWSAWA